MNIIYTIISTISISISSISSSISSTSSSSSSGAGAGSWVLFTPPRAATPARVDYVGLRRPRLSRPGGPAPRVLLPGRRRRPPPGRRLNSESCS